MQSSGKSNNSALDRRTRRRYCRDRRFWFYCVTALVLACTFLVVFLGDIFQQGHSAFWQAEIKVEASYSQEVVDLPVEAVSEEIAPLLSRSWYRELPQKLRKNPEMIGTREEKWVLATAEVDQYLKDKPHGLSPEQIGLVDNLQEDERTRQVFNIYFFTQGDSRLPESAGIFSAAVGTVYVMIVTMAFSLPTGVLTAIYLEEFASDNWFTRAIEVNINNLAAIPSILYGLLGLAIFISFVGIPRSSALVGGLTLGLMSLPYIIISSRAAIRSVPDSIREAAFAVGASRWQVVSHHVLPLSLPGILTGSIIALAQAMGETAPLLIVGMMAFVPEAPGGFLDASTVMPAQIFSWSSAALRPFAERTAAGIMVLLTVLICLNLTAVLLRKRYGQRW